MAIEHVKCDYCSGGTEYFFFSIYLYKLEANYNIVVNTLTSSLWLVATMLHRSREIIHRTFDSRCALLPWGPLTLTWEDKQENVFLPILRFHKHFYFSILPPSISLYIFCTTLPIFLST